MVKEQPHPPEQREELAQDAPFVHRFGRVRPDELPVPFWSFTLFEAADAEGQRHVFWVPTAAVENAANVTLPADHDRVEVERLREALGEIKRFAEAHHGGEQPHIWLHGLTVDIPALVDSALDMRPPKPPRPPADREMA